MTEKENGSGQGKPAPGPSHANSVTTTSRIFRQATHGNTTGPQMFETPHADVSTPRTALNTIAHHDYPDDIDETETRRPLDDFVREYLDARGRENVTQLELSKDCFKSTTLIITAHTDVQDEPPAIITETDAISHHGHRYDLQFIEDPYGPVDLNRITLYAADTISGMDPVTLDDGLATADDYMKTFLHSDTPLPSHRID